MKLSKQQLINMLEDIVNGIKEDDSFDGTFKYEATGAQEFEVSAFYRVGNSQGQGGCRMIRATEEPDNE